MKDRRSVQPSEIDVHVCARTVYALSNCFTGRPDHPASLMYDNISLVVSSVDMVLADLTNAGEAFCPYCLNVARLKFSKSFHATEVTKSNVPDCLNSSAHSAQLDLKVAVVTSH